MAHPLVPPMLEVMNQSFRAFEIAPQPDDLVAKRDILHLFVVAAGIHTAESGLIHQAMKSLGFCAFTNYSKARKVFDMPATATRASTAILELATLAHGSEQNIQVNDVAMDLELGVEVLYPEMLVPEFDPEPHLELHEFYTKKLDIMRLKGHGCPAHGPVLNTMYRRYVDILFAPELEQEAATINSVDA